MGKEASLWDLVRANLSPFAHLERVENRVNVGTPDVNYCLNGGKGEGWLELKDADAWPARAETVLRIEHVTDVQRAWWRARRAAGGAVFVLLRVGRGDYLLMDGVAAAAHLGLVPRAALEQISIVVSPTPAFPKLLILRTLMNNWKKDCF